MIDTTGKDIHQVAEEIFKLLVEQGERCMGVNGCVYGNSKGQHCAVGFLLPEDSKELMSYEGAVSDLMARSDLGKNALFIENNKHKLDVIQILHDEAFKGIRLKQRQTLRDMFNITNKYIDQWVEMGE